MLQWYINTCGVKRGEWRALSASQVPEQSEPIAAQLRDSSGSPATATARSFIRMESLISPQSREIKKRKHKMFEWLDSTVRAAVR